MTTRMLPPAEWPRLAGTLLAEVWPHLDPAATDVIVCEQDGRIVGCAALLTAWHLEGVWSDPASLVRIGINRRLVRALRAALAARGIREVLMMATSPASARLCRGFGQATHLACDHFAVQV